MKYREVLFVTYINLEGFCCDGIEQIWLPKDVFTSYFQFCIQELYEVDDHLL